MQLPGDYTSSILPGVALVVQSGKTRSKRARNDVIRGENTLRFGEIREDSRLTEAPTPSEFPAEHSGDPSQTDDRREGKIFT
jgi:hypothetical protein